MVWKHQVLTYSASSGARNGYMEGPAPHCSMQGGRPLWLCVGATHPCHRGTDLVSVPVPKKLLIMAGNKPTKGCIANLGSFAKATFDAISKTCSYLNPDLWKKNLFTKIPDQILGTLTFHQPQFTYNTRPHLPANYQLSKTNSLKMEAQGPQKQNHKCN